MYDAHNQFLKHGSTAVIIHTQSHSYHTHTHTRHHTRSIWRFEFRTETIELQIESNRINWTRIDRLPIIVYVRYFPHISSLVLRYIEMLITFEWIENCRSCIIVSRRFGSVRFGSIRFDSSIQIRSRRFHSKYGNQFWYDAHTTEDTSTHENHTHFANTFRKSQHARQFCSIIRDIFSHTYLMPRFDSWILVDNSNQIESNRKSIRIESIETDRDEK